ncbi:Outer membrane protein U [Vibrio chagasii]|uniref:porin n=1 Tax=Vibrio chagasii TaxID=170679 RepID=UPI001EFEC53D|nr:porin [Vibrio chagasii]MCG9675428.1 porin [Vibrio chagasii]CAH6826171.1 Outer membrane protein U [Vibrio chagasii]CAH6925633.1 Outer membrane protein U [Vibrio chagasii]CAH6997123.1 Outer membrane protein U [Vibrio chagasii]CAH7080809.1 Outer membrane protein U [Vibrio chagasii]
MNKTMIALAVSAAALATNAVAADGKQAGGIDGTSVYSSNGTSLEIGGRAEARLSLKDGKAEDRTRVRLNFLGKVEIQDGLYGVGFYEGEYTTADNTVIVDGKPTSGNDIDHRYTYAGIGGNFGEVTYGKNDGALGVITDFTDIMSYHGNSAAYKIAAADRTDNMLSYKGEFQDLAVKASYRFADRTDSVDGGYSDNNEDGYSLSGIYSIGDTGFKLGAGYADQDVENEYMLAASYRTETLYFAGTFTDGELAKRNGDYTGYEFATAYTLDKTAFTLTYNNAETDGETSADNVAIDATYYFKPNFRTYISYNFNLISENDTIGTVGLGNGTASKADAEDELALGLRYDF